MKSIGNNEREIDLLRQEAYLLFSLNCDFCERVDDYHELWDNPEVIQAGKMNDFDGLKIQSEDEAHSYAWSLAVADSAFDSGWRASDHGKYQCPDCAKQR